MTHNHFQPLIGACRFNLTKIALIPVPDKLLQPKWPAMPGINRRYSELLQLFDAGARGFKIVNNGIELRLFGVFEKITTKKVAARCQDS